jgi:hypothetical protein
MSSKGVVLKGGSIGSILLLAMVAMTQGSHFAK